jgi:hypothetical protein
MATPIPDPEHVSWLQAIVGFLMGILTLIGAKFFKRTETDIDRSGKETKDNIKETRDHIKESDTRYSHIETRLAILEDRKLVTMPELRLAIREALEQARELFTPQHEGLERTFMAAIEESEKRNATLVQQCNTALRTDLEATAKAVNRIFKLISGLQKPSRKILRKNIKRR